MKDIQKRYLELKAEVTYLDRKRRRARRREREGKPQSACIVFLRKRSLHYEFAITASRLQAVSPANSSSLQSMSHPPYPAPPPQPSLPALNPQPLLTETELSHKLPTVNT